MPRYKFELLTGGENDPTVEHTEWVEAADDQTAKQEARAWAATVPAALSQATRVRVRNAEKIAIWTHLISSEL